MTILELACYALIVCGMGVAGLVIGLILSNDRDTRDIERRLDAADDDVTNRPRVKTPYHYWSR